MQGGREPRRGIYVARRVVAALVVLLLLILFVPWACQNLLGPGEQSSSETSETDDTDSSDEGGEEAARDEKAAKDDGGDTAEDSGGERGDTVRDSGSEAGPEDDEEDSGDEEDGESSRGSNIESNPLGFVGGFEAVGGVEQVPPTLDLGVANQQAAQPAVPAEPVFLAGSGRPTGPPARTPTRA